MQARMSSALLLSKYRFSHSETLTMAFHSLTPIAQPFWKDFVTPVSPHQAIFSRSQGVEDQLMSG